MASKSRFSRNMPSRISFSPSKLTLLLHFSCVSYFTFQSHAYFEFFILFFLDHFSTEKALQPFYLSFQNMNNSTHAMCTIPLTNNYYSVLRFMH